MADKHYQRETAGAVAAPINLITVEHAPADWIQAVAGGALTFKDGSGTSVTYANVTAGEVLRGPFREITSSAGKLRYGTGEGPAPSVSVTGDAGSAATSATAAAGSATAAATSATQAAGTALSLSATVITADPAPAVIGTMYVCNPSGGAFNVTLPAIGSGNHNKRIGFTVATTSGNAVTPVPDGTDTLPGGFTSVPGTYGFAILQADNNASPKVWRRVG